MKQGTLFLLPCPIGDGAPEEVLPAANFEVMRRLGYFIVENVRSARRFLSRAGMGPIDQMEFAELNEHTKPEEVSELLGPLLAGRDGGVISEAGVPAVADPGADIVAAAHRAGIRVVPMVGPSSILLALMASGMNGQSFAFNGYLPVKPAERVKAIRHYEKRAQGECQAQIFIETPYRNDKLLAELLAVCSPGTKLCVAADISTPGEQVRTATVAEWKKSQPLSGIGKRPAIFIIG